MGWGLGVWIFNKSTRDVSVVGLSIIFWGVRESGITRKVVSKDGERRKLFKMFLVGFLVICLYIILFFFEIVLIR